MRKKNAERKRPTAGRSAKFRRSLLFSAALLILVLLAGGLYLHLAWARYQVMKQKEVLALAEAAEVLMHTDHAIRLTAEAGAEGLAERRLLQNSLTRLVEHSEDIHYACILVRRDGGLSVLLGSETTDPLSGKHIREETEEMNLSPFLTGESVLAPPVKSPYGSWIRALVPIKAAGGGVVGVLELSYSAPDWQREIWQKMRMDFAVVASLIFLSLTLRRLWLEHLRLEEKSRELALQEEMYYSVFAQAPIGITLVDNKKDAVQAGFNSINPMAEQILQRDFRALSEIKWSELTHPDDLQSELGLFQRFVQGEISSYSIEKRVRRPDGSYVWVNAKIADFTGGPMSSPTYLCLLEDISARKVAEEALKESERSKSVLLSHLPGMAYRCKYDEHWTLEFVSEGCKALTGYGPESLLYNRDLSYNDMIFPEYRTLLRNEWERVLAPRKSFRAEYELITKTGERKWVLELGQGIYDKEGEVEALEGIVLDLSEQKKREARISYLSEHDFLTGLYNRSRIEGEKKRLDQPELWPLSVAICDIDGLRVINDAFGYEEGDRLIAETARLIRSCCRADDVVGRMSGDEFILLLPRTENREAQRLVKEIQNTVETYNRRGQLRYEISLSIGFSTRESCEQSIEELISTAEDYLKHRKLLNQKSSHHAILSSVMATLYAKSQETEEHGQRLGRLAQMVGEHLGMEQKGLDDLQLLCMLHDIGKIGVDDRILNKPGRLTAEEREEMRQHPEIGHRIAMSTPQLQHIAKYILHHHERWDGTGYPMGLEGQGIPLVSRILAVADAYDAMTVDRVYRRALPWEAALEELERCSGSQFDPSVAMLFIELVSARKAEIGPGEDGP